MNHIHVFTVQVYLNLNRSIDELYYENYDNVAVMFASLTDYKLGVENDVDMSENFVLSILNEVISDFDRVSNNFITFINQYTLKKSFTHLYFTFQEPSGT